MDIEYIIRQAINGLSLGSVYALIAIGYTMVYGVIRLINFAHGEILMFGAFFGYMFLYWLPGGFSMPFVLAVLLAMALAALLGVTIERVAYKKLRKSPRLSVLITAIGMSLFLQNSALAIFGSEFNYIKVGDIGFLSGSPFVIGGIEVSRLYVSTIGLSVMTMIGLQLFVLKTKAGKAMRAVSQDKEAALLMGINVDKTISMTFAIGSALGALGGIFFSLATTKVFPAMGIIPGLKAFVAAVFGGIGSIFGAMLGGYSIGIVEAFLQGNTATSSWVDLIVFGLLIVVLLLKPTGLVGKNLKEKV